MKTMKTTSSAPSVVLPQPPSQGLLWLWFKFFLAVFGMNTLIGMEFRLPDLGAYYIYPEQAIQAFAFLFAAVVASLLFWPGLRLRKRG